MNIYKNTFMLLIAGLIAFACGGSSSQESESSAAAETEVESPAQPAVPDTAVLVIEGNDLMQFNLKELDVTAGQVVKLTLKHTGQMAKEAMGHNWVLLASGTDKATFGAAAVAARDNGYIPQDMADQVIASTDLVGGGEETTVIFEAPPMGYYDYICSFPGHWGVMQGTLTVNPL